MRDGDAVQNAIGVAYLEHLNFDGRRARAIDVRSMLSTRLERAISALGRDADR